MTGTRWTTVIFLSVIILAASSFAMGGGPRPQFIERFGDELELSKEQTQKLETLRYEMEKKSIDMRAELDKARLELNRLQDSEKIDRKAILSQAEKVNSLEGKLKIAKIEHMLDIAETLTPEQRAMLKERQPEGRKGDRRNPESCEGMEHEGRPKMPSRERMREPLAPEME